MHCRDKIADAGRLKQVLSSLRRVEAVFVLSVEHLYENHVPVLIMITL